ncbi:MAG: hypothetical protein JXR84_26295, partial [Anaerolineae bacterium]|nr:hypothetical protein [Anaerolineae bacterium]
MNQHPRWACLALLLLACLLRFWDLGGQSLWYDEAYTWWVATQVTMEESITSSIHEVIPPGSYLLWRGWVALTGETEFALRSVSALLGVLTVAAAGRVAWWLTQRHAGAVAALALFTIAPPMLWASREVRMYGPVLCFSLLADAALLETLFGPARTRARWAWGWGISALLSLYMLVLAGFWLIGQGVFALIVLLKSALSVQSADQKKRLEIPSSLRALLFPAVAATVLYLPWLLAASRSLGVNRGYWAGYLPPQAFLRTTFQGITVFDFIADEAWAFVISGLILLLAALSLLLTRRKPLAGLYPLCYALPALALLVPLYRTLPKWGLRHSTIFAPAPYLALAVAWGTVGGLPSRRRRLATLALGMSSVLVSGYLLIASANLLEAARLSPVFAHEDWRGVAQYVTENRAPEDLIIIETGSVFPTWVYYAGRDRILPLPDDALLDVTHVLNYENTAPLLNESLQSATGVWLVNWLA